MMSRFRERHRHPILRTSRRILTQTRKSGGAITTSALPPTADTPESGRDVRKVPSGSTGLDNYTSV
jgi:hypothetical protein